MKNPFVKDLTADQVITGFFLVHEKEVRNTNTGKPYLRMELGDRSGTVEARMWEQFENCAKAVNRDDFIKVQARVEIYRNRPQLSVQQVRLAKPEEIDITDFLAHTPFDVDEMYQQLLSEAEAIKNPWLRRLSLKRLRDPNVASRFKRAPAAKVMHHAYIGGLLEHVVGLCALAKLIALHYPELDVDLLLTAAMLHDVGKLDELCYERSVQYTIEGQLLGHIVIELETVAKAMEAIPGFPPKLKAVVQHMLISHHGQYEFGSPKLPMIREALVFHYLDDMDFESGGGTVGNGGGDRRRWLVSLQRGVGAKILRLERYLAEPLAEDSKE